MAEDDRLPAGTLSDVTTGLYMITAVCGLVDAACFLALGGVFAEMMTGNLLLLSLSLGTGMVLGDILRYGTAIAAFVLGALLGGRLLRGPRELRERRIGFAVEGAVLAGAAATAWLTAPDAHNDAGHAVLGLLAFAMGIQNAMVRVHGVPDLATNLMTVTFTGLVADSTPAGGDNANWRRRTLSILLFMTSAALGAALLPFGIHWPLSLATVILVLAMRPLLFGRHPLGK